MNGKRLPRNMAPHCGCASKSAWLQDGQVDERIEFIDSEKTLGLGEAARTKTTNTSISSRISNDPRHPARKLDHVGVLLARLRLQWLLHHFSLRLVWTAYVCVMLHHNRAARITRFATGSPFVFPSLGPTAYLFFFSRWRKSRALAIPFWPCYWAHLRLRGLRAHMTATPPFGAHAAVHGPTVLAPLSRSRLRARSWFCFG